MSKTDILKRINEKLPGAVQKHAVPVSLFFGEISGKLRLYPENIVVWFPKGNRSVGPARVHHRYVLMINLRNAFNVKVDKEKIEIPKDKGLLIFPFQTHSPSQGEEMKDTMWMAVTFTLGENMESYLLPLKNHVFDISPKDTEILIEFAETALGVRSEGKNEVAYILARLICRKLEELEPPVHNLSKHETLPLYNKIVDYIKANLSRHMSVKDISKLFNVSERHLRRIFKRHTGELTLGRLIINTRVKLSYELLMHTGMSIAEIAEKCGFSDQFVFSKSFKKATNLSPSNYRKAYQNKSR